MLEEIAELRTKLKHKRSAEVRRELAGFHRNFLGNIHRQPPNAIESAALLEFQYGLKQEPQELLSHRVYHENIQIRDTYEYVVKELPEALKEVPEAVQLLGEQTEIILMYGLARGLVDPTKFPVQVQKHLDERLEEELFLLENGIVATSTKSSMTRPDSAPSIDLPMLIHWAGYRGVNTDAAVTGCLDTLARQELRATARTHMQYPSRLAWGAIRGLYTRDDVKNALSAQYAREETYEQDLRKAIFTLFVAMNRE